ncbi:hypothetical protein OE88DRAFT_1651633 [Heliocybe sulcata]|uniref:Uncharacterized protein n=1 Tax=Heliocybe sulcata TaxID=5364 RepID=A0A5C3NCE9_9AGAM|nr:hypothetical protein OE88DRAFT_1651633 [Heliocybe sulcata]
MARPRATRRLSASSHPFPRTRSMLVGLSIWRTVHRDARWEGSLRIWVPQRCHGHSSLGQ